MYGMPSIALNFGGSHVVIRIGRKLLNRSVENWSKHLKILIMNTAILLHSLNEHLFLLMPDTGLVPGRGQMPARWSSVFMRMSHAGQCPTILIIRKPEKALVPY
jgi:hypothetical protein